MLLPVMDHLNYGNVKVVSVKNMAYGTYHQLENIFLNFDA